jgi:hypothetical protein
LKNGDYAIDDEFTRGNMGRSITCWYIYLVNVDATGCIMNHAEKLLEALRAELLNIRERMSDATHGQSVCEIHKKGRPSNALKQYEGMEYVVRDAVRNLEASQDLDVLENLLQLKEAEFSKIKTSRIGQSPYWQSYAEGGLNGVQLVRRLMAHCP